MFHLQLLGGWESVEMVRRYYTASDLEAVAALARYRTLAAQPSRLSSNLGSTPASVSRTRRAVRRRVGRPARALYIVLWAPARIPPASGA